MGKIRELEIKLAAVLSEFHARNGQYEETISKLKIDFEMERKILKNQIAKEQEVAEKNKTQLKALHASLVTELQKKISQLETKNELNEVVIFKLNHDLLDTNAQVKCLEKKLQCRQFNPKIENIEAQEIFSLLGNFFQENSKAWNEVESICMGSKC